MDPVMELVVNKGHGLSGLAKRGLETVPESYVQPPEARFNDSEVVVVDIPVIDVSNIENDPEVGNKVCKAARKHGFFQIVNHGIPDRVLEAVQDAARSFFAQPAEEKLAYKSDSYLRGSATYGTSFRPGTEDKVFDWRDYLNLRYFSDQDASQTWPPICKDESLQYRKGVMVVAKKIYDALLKGLNINGWSDETISSVLMGSATIQFNYYPICPNPELAVGLGCHSDATCITILLQDDVGGLYVRPENGVKSWVFVPPTKGALVINIGDSMQILSNGCYNSIEHRVALNSTKSRLSIPTFISPSHSQILAPLPEALAAGETPLYREIMYGDYLKYYLGKRNDGKANINFVKI